MVAKHLGDIKVRYDSIGRVELCVMHDIPRFLHSVKINIVVDNESRYSLTFVRLFENAIVNSIKKYLKRSGSVFKKFFTPPFTSFLPLNEKIMKERCFESFAFLKSAFLSIF